MPRGILLTACIVLRGCLTRYRKILEGRRVLEGKRSPTESADHHMVEAAVRDEAFLRFLSYAESFGFDLTRKTLCSMIAEKKPRSSWTWPKADSDLVEWYEAKAIAERAVLESPPKPKPKPATERTIVERVFTLNGHPRSVRRQLERLINSGFVKRTNEGRLALFSLTFEGRLFVAGDSPLIPEVNTYRRDKGQSPFLFLAWRA